MRSSGAVTPTDWRLYACDHVRGEDYLDSWGPEEEARRSLASEAARGRDVWLVSPEGKKVLPS